MVKRGAKRFSISNRLLYTLILVFVLVFVGAGVYAIAGGAAGHTMDTTSAPSGCGANRVLEWTGSSWTCGPLSIPTCDSETQGMTWNGVAFACANLG